MMCQSTGRPPISTIGFGLNSVSSRILVPSPPARMTAGSELLISRLYLKAPKNDLETPIHYA
jgi:hypothetical protein